MVLTGPSSKRFWDLVNRLELVPIPPQVEPVQPPPTRQFQFTAAQRQAVVAAYSSGRSMASLAAEYQVKRASISKLLRRAGLEIRVRRQMSQEQIDEAVRLYIRGRSLEQIGSQLGWDHNTIYTIYRHLLKRGVHMRGRMTGSGNETRAPRYAPSLSMTCCAMRGMSTVSRSVVST